MNWIPNTELLSHLKDLCVNIKEIIIYKSKRLVVCVKQTSSPFSFDDTIFHPA